MKPRPRNVLLLLVAVVSVLLVFAAMLVGIFSLRQSSENDTHAEILAHVVLENAYALDAMEWQAISPEKGESAGTAAIEEHRAAIDTAIDSMTRLFPGETGLTKLRQTCDRYEKASDEEYNLISAGRIPEAVALDDELVDPTFKQLESLATQVALSHHEAAESTNSMSSYLIVMICLLALIIVGMLSWMYSTILLKHRQVSAEKTLLELSEERFRSVAQSANEAIITIDEQARVTYWNSAATRIFGHPEHEIMGQDISRIIPERFLEAHQAGINQVANNFDTKVASGSVERFGLRNDGSEIPIELSLSQWQSKQGTFLTAIIHDITERKQAEERLASQTTALEQGNLQLAMLYEVGLTISNTIELQQLLDNTLEAIEGSGILQGQRESGILLVKDNKLTLASHIGHSEEFLALHNEIGIGECLCGLAMEKDEIIVSVDSSHDDRHTIRYPGMKPHGHVIVPLKAMDKVVGVLYLYTAPGTHMDENRKRLLATIGSQLGIAIENARFFEKTKELSLHDPLTGLANRSLMNIELRKNFVIARRKKRPLSLIMLDLDHFKNFNDTYGHPAGDKLLADIAAIITGKMRETDLVARYGGEEFLIILPETDSRAAMQIAERIRVKIMQTGFHLAGKQKPGHITVSQGVATYDQKVEVNEEDRLIVMADEALYHAKNSGRNRVAIFEGLGDVAEL